MITNRYLFKRQFHTLRCRRNVSTWRNFRGIQNITFVISLIGRGQWNFIFKPLFPIPYHRYNKHRWSPFDQSHQNNRIRSSNFSFSVWKLIIINYDTANDSWSEIVCSDGLYTLLSRLVCIFFFIQTKFDSWNRFVIFKFVFIIDKWSWRIIYHGYVQLLDVSVLLSPMWRWHAA